MPDIIIKLTDEQVSALESQDRHPLIANIMRRVGVAKETLTAQDFIQEFVNSITVLAVQKKQSMQQKVALKAKDEIPILEARLAVLKAAMAETKV
jgi:hypothetical protein